jgi:hypothetical protein
MRRSLRFEGIPMALFFRRKRKRLKRLVLIADVSGSMEAYARFVMPLVLGLKGVGSRVVRVVGDLTAQIQELNRGEQHVSEGWLILCVWLLLLRLFAAVLVRAIA